MAFFNKILILVFGVTLTIPEGSVLITLKPSELHNSCGNDKPGLILRHDETGKKVCSSFTTFPIPIKIFQIADPNLVTDVCKEAFIIDGISNSSAFFLASSIEVAFPALTPMRFHLPAKARGEAQGGAEYEFFQLRERRPQAAIRTRGGERLQVPALRGQAGGLRQLGRGRGARAQDRIAPTAPHRFGVDVCTPIPYLRSKRLSGWRNYQRCKMIENVKLIGEHDDYQPKGRYPLRLMRASQINVPSTIVIRTIQLGKS